MKKKIQSIYPSKLQRKRATYNQSPLVSIIMPIRNGAAYVREAILSILSQTYRNFELIIIDDHSHDETPIILSVLKKVYPRKIRIITLPKKMGAYGAANKAMKIAKGEFIAPMDSDDISAPDRIEKQVAFLLANPDHVLVGSQALIIDRDGVVTGKRIYPTSHEEIYLQYIDSHPIVHPSCMIRRSILPKWDKLYYDRYGVSDDYYTLFSLLRFGKFANIDEYLLKYRIHMANSSLQHIKKKFFISVKIRLMAISELDYSPQFFGLLKMIAQIAVIACLPEWVFLRIYLMIKRSISPIDILGQFTKWISPYMIRMRKYSYSIVTGIMSL